MKVYRYAGFWIFILTVVKSLHAQLSPYHGIVFPYDNPNRVVYSAGSLTYAALDYSANIHNNPVSFSFVQKPRLFVIFNQEVSRYYITGINKDFFLNGNIKKEKGLDAEYELYPRFISCVLPLNIAKHRIFLSASLNKIRKPEHEVWLQGNEYPGLDPELDFHHQRDGHVWNASINIGYVLPFNINLGITWTKWFGSWHWYDYNTPNSVIGEGIFKYNGNNFSIGLLKKYKNQIVSISYHTPLSLMEADDISIESRGEYKYTLQQKFNGALKIGIGFILNDKTTLSFGYRYQDKFSIRKTMFWHAGSDMVAETIDEYGSAHQIAIACEYIVHCKGNKLPIFLTYWADWLPKEHEVGEPIIYQDFSPDYHYHFPELYANIAAGISFPFYSFNIHFASQLNIFPIETIYFPYRYNTYPPLSFNAKKMSVVFSLCVSYDFRGGG